MTLTGTATRKLALSYKKQFKVTTSINELAELRQQVLDLKKYASAQFEYWAYEFEGEDETNIAWNFDKANSHLKQLLQAIVEQVDILETRIERKLQQSKERRAA